MIVTTCAIEGGSQKNGARGHDTINDVANVHFLFDHATFICRDVAAIKARRDLLVLCGLGQQVAEQPGGDADGDPRQQVTFQGPHRA